MARPNARAPTPSSSSAPPATSPTRRSSRRCRRWRAAGELDLPGRSAWPSRAGRATSSSSARGPASPSTAASTTRPSPSSPRCCATSTATTTTRRPSRGCAPSSAARAAAGPLPGDPAEHVPDRGRAARAARAAPTNARVIVEKPFGRDLASAREPERDPPRGASRGEHLPHRPLPRQGGGAEHPLLPLRQRLPRADLEPATTSRTCRSRWPRASASRAAASSTRRPASSAT